MAKVTLSIYGQKYKFEMTNAQESIMKVGHAAQYNYQVNIPNPSFDLGLPIDPITNTPLIANPISREDFCAQAILNGILSRFRDRRLEEVQKTNNAAATVASKATVDAELTAITIVEDMSP